MEITSKTLITRKEDIMATNLDGEIVMMNIDTGNYYSLGKTGSMIWNILEESMEVRELVNKLMELYQVSEQRCEVEVMNFVKEMLKEGLIVVG
ncbi:MAG: hypothetical protein K0R00_2700 [Herbinix sp.]|jgi:hypothetical protein|nr:hypothetical protein [Herbinix sp.]